MNYFQLYEAERRTFHVGAKFTNQYNLESFEITHIQDIYKITIKYLTGSLRGYQFTLSKDFIRKIL